MLARRATPSFCVIAPTAYLDLTAARTNTHLVLAHVADHDDQYADFYRRMSDRGDYIICDNGAFELGESYAPDKLIQLGHKVGANALVLPDYPLQHADVTIAAAEKYIPIFKSAGFDTFYAPQSEPNQLEQWIHAYRWGAGHPDVDIVGMSILGIPAALPHIPAAYARVVMAQLLVDRGVFNFNKSHHWLGLNAGPALEIPPLLKMGVMDTCDSSGPVWSAICGHEYTHNSDSYLTAIKPKKHVDFDYGLVTDKLTLDRIQRNVTMTLDLFDV